jgi:prenyltransferase beta subunit
MADSSVARNLRGLYFLSETYSDLQMSTEPLCKGLDSVWGLQNPYGGFGTVDRVYVEVPSELEATYCAVATLQNLGAPVDGRRVVAFVERFRNADGGFGGEGRSILASTHYALATLARLGYSAEHAQETLAWLRQHEERWDIEYLEDLFWLTQALEALGQGVRRRENGAAFTLGCQRPSGGFGRAHWGIATLEDTHHAVAVLKSAGYLGDEGRG